MRKKITFALLSLLLVPLGMMAQNVTIKATNGSMIASVPTGTSDYDTFFPLGGFATWQHEQLNMVLTASDQTGLTDFGQLSNPANNLFSDGGKVQIGKGAGNGATVCYLTLSLPKGYRFTGYTIKFSKPTGLPNNFNSANAASTFGETNSTFANYVESANVARGGEATIGRTSLSDSDMGNVLYFKLQGPSNSRAMITLESAEFFFTAEANYQPLTTPGAAERVSAIDIPFKTSKVDYGPIEPRTYAQAQRISYGSANVKDLEANFTLYEAGATKSGTDFDGTSGEVVDYRTGSISIEDGYYRIGAADADAQDALAPDAEEHIYYIETPSYAMLSDRETKNPVGYRITGAEIKYKYGKTNVYGSETKTYNTFSLEFWLIVNHYVNSNAGVSSSSSNKAMWFMDEEGYVRTGDIGRIYLAVDEDGYAYTTTNKANATVFSKQGGYNNTSNPIYVIRNGRNLYPHYQGLLGFYRLVFGEGYGLLSPRFQLKYSGNVQIEKHGVIATRDAKPYKLRLYNSDGEGYQEVTVNGTNPIRPLTLDGMNNDAVKIGVIGTGLIQGTLKLQALNPYLDQVTAVCEDKNPSRNLIQEQEFTASDFSVNGGDFFFYLPEAAVPSSGSGDLVEITFKDLKSRYFDNTYEGGSSSHNSRLNFVKSAHYNAFGLSKNNIYNDRDEAKNAQKDRLSVDVAGTTAFKFNNAKDLSSAEGYLTEYPFSLENYSGNFNKIQFNVSKNDQNVTRYLFTTDETRYNIAPTTAIQHRAYAYYKMTAHVQAKAFTPEVTFKEVYDRTLYRELKADKTYGGAKEDAHYGAVVTAKSGNIVGALSTTEILTAIGNKMMSQSQSGNAPADAKHLLYVDLSQLSGVYQDNSTSMQTFVGSFATNGFVFLPEGASASYDNVAYKMGSGFYAANNIVLTDMQPFYTPYDIRLRSANMVSYERKIEKSTYGKSTTASVMMPFAMEVDNSGVHTNLDNSTIKLHSMQASNSLTHMDGKTYAYFPGLSGVSSTVANHPYLVQVSNIPEDKEGFTVTQKATMIVACPEVDNTTAYTEWKNGRYLFDGENASATFTDGDSQGSFNFKNYGTYAGIKINKNDNVFYFANNMFVNSATLASAYSYANIAPFRAFYATRELTPLDNPSNSTGGAKLMNFGIIFGEGEGDVPSGIYAVDAAQMLDVNAPVYDLQGRKVASSYREAKSLLRSGMYVVNGVKIVVK